MADEPMLSLFDADGGFMGELTNSSDGGLGTQEYNRGLPASENGMMNQGLPGMQVQRTMPAQPDMMMHQQQSQNLQGYPQHHNVAQNNFRGMNPQAVMMNRQPYPGQPDAYNQYNQVPKLHHMNDSNSIMMSGQNPNIMAQNIRQQAPQQQTFGSPPQNSLMPGQQPGYHNYNMSPRPRMASQAKQMGMVANSQWPPNQPQQSSPNQQQQYMAAQQNRQQQMIVGNNHMSSYPQQHDFNMQQQSQQSVGHYPNNTQQPQPHYMQGMRSPPTGNRMPMPMSPNNMNMMAQMQQRPIKPAQPFPHSQAATSQSNMMPNYNAHQTIQQPRFTGEYMSEGPQLTPGTNPQANHQHYSSFSGNQHVPVSPVATGMGDANALTHFTTNRSPNSMQYHQSYTGMGQPLPGQPGPQAPSPHSSSGSTTPSLLTNVSQGNFGQSSLQQLEQLVSPSVGGISAANPFQQVMQSTPNSNLNVAPKQMIYSSTNFQTTTVSSTGSVNGTPIQSGMSMSGTNGPVSAPINTDPSQPMMPSNPNHQQNVNMEVQRLQQQIQHLYNMPQTQQIQQQMLDLQEKMRMLKAQQQQHFLQMQKQQIQPRPNLVGAPPNHNIPGQQQVRMPQPNPGNPTVPQMNTTQVMGVQQQSNIPSQSKDSNIPPPQFGQYGNQQNMLPSLGDSLETPSFGPTIQGLPTSTSQPPSSLSLSQQSSIQSTHQGLNTPETCPPLSPPSLDPYKFTPLDADPPPLQNLEMPGLVKSNQNQEKANRIIADAIAKAQASGVTDLPKVMSPEHIPPTDGTEGDSSPEKKPRKKRTKKTEDGVNGEKKEKKPRKPRTPKDPNAANTPKEPKKRKRKSKTGDDTSILADSIVGDISLPVPVIDAAMADSTSDVTQPAIGEEDSVPPSENGEIPVPIPVPVVPEPEPEPVSSLFTKRKKPPATFMQKGKTKRKRAASPDLSDLDVSPQGSPNKEDDNTNKRRSSRNTKRKKYMDDLDLNLSDDNHDVDIEAVDNAPVAMKSDQSPGEEVIVVEKILGSRIRKYDEDDDEKDKSEEGEEEFLVKFKNYSHLHCDWKTQKELEAKDKRILGKLKRYRLKKQQTNVFEMNDEDEYFNPDYTEVDRVLDEQIAKDPATQQEMTYFLIKWRSMAYEDCTWELQQDVDPKKVEDFRKFRTLPSPEERVHKERPSPDEWKQLPKSRDYKNNNSIREYQLEGVNWLTFCYYNRQNCILADEMGLGKTIQSITFLHEIDLYGIHGPFLVVAPLSTIANWQREFETWTDMNVITYHGTAPSRNMIQEYEIYYRDSAGNKIPGIYKIHALITTYEIIISDVDLISSIKWRCLIIDEAHRLKNRNCRLMDGLNKIDLEHRVLLTGTPLQNNTDELFSLLNFLEPKQFASSEAFVGEFGNLKTESQVDQLKEILKPMMLRRLKEDVEKNLAPKEETIVEVELTNIQKKYYRAILERNFTFLSKGATGSANVPNLMNTMMELRKCCNHPFLIKGAEDKIMDDMKTKTPTDIDPTFTAMVQSCGKMVLMDKLLPKLKQGGHKVLIFSQMIKVLDILEDYLVHKHYLYERLDGRIRGNIRQEAIDRFSKKDSDRFVFLLCTRAGGLGINLTAADTCIIYDSDWNPQNDLQAQARCHRIGQQKAVKIYRLVTRNSYEREMFDRASMKLGLDKAVLQSLGGEKPGTNQPSQLSKKEVEELLKKGAYGALMDDDTAGDDFCEEDIDQILKRRTQVIQIESEGKGSTFAKASFSLSTNRTDIDINDPEFWQKWAKKADIDVDEIQNRNELIIDLPRRRKQTTRFGNDDTVVDMSELESSSDSDEEGKATSSSKRKSKRKSRKDDDEDFNDEYTGDGYCRSECFKVEKSMMVYGWGRWGDILNHVRFKRRLDEKDIETIARGILVCCLSTYKGDDKIKSFILDLVSPNSNAVLKNHKGLSAPVPRGRKSNKKRDPNIPEPVEPESEKFNIDLNPASVLDPAYTRHLDRHSNKVLLRVRLLYYLKQEIVGEEAHKVFQGANIKDINIPKPSADRDTPTFWWDELADRSLIVGVFKHGYEKFNQIRSDPTLVFLSRCGPPDGAALLREQNEENDDKNDDDDFDDDEASMTSAPESKKSTNPSKSEDNGDKLPFPDKSELNSRLRRLITCYQRGNKKRIMEMEMQQRKLEKRGRSDLAMKEREYRRRESLQNRWSRREEADFYKTASSFGVEIDRKTGRFIWDKFRSLAKLDKKFDDTLTEYFQGFYFMCQKVCGKLGKEIKAPPNTMYVEPITEERAARCLARIDIINKIREEMLYHPKLDEHIQLCQPSFDMPRWWICGKHDKELLIGAARHGVARTDYHILRDPTLSFHEVFTKATARGNNSPFSHLNPNGTPGTPSTPRGETPNLLKEELENETPSKKSVKSESSQDVKEEKDPSIKKESPVKMETNEDEEGSDKEAVKDSDSLKKTSDSPLKSDSPTKDKSDSPTKDKSDSPNKDRSDSPHKDASDSPHKDASDLPHKDASDLPNKDASDLSNKDEIDLPNKDESDSPNKDKIDSPHKDTSESPIKSEVETELKKESDSPIKSEKPEVDDSKPTNSEVKEEVTVNGDTSDNECDKGEGKESGSLKEEKIKVEKDIVKTENETEAMDTTESKDSKDFVKIKEKKEEVEEDELIKRELRSVTTPRQFPGMYNEDYLEMEGLEPGEITGSKSFFNPQLEWPKDRVIFHRLEHICYTVEKGEWPFSKKGFPSAAFDSRSTTPVGSSTPKGDTPHGDSDIEPTFEGIQVMIGESPKDLEAHMSEGEGLRMKIQKRSAKSSSGRRSKYDIDSDRASRVQQLLNQSHNPPSGASSDNESLTEAMSMSGMSMSAEGFLNGHSELDATLLRNSLIEQGLLPERRKRGRKKKAEKMAELAMAEALAKRHHARMSANLDPELRIPVINIEDGTRLSGDEAPKKKHLEEWLIDHPGFVVEQPDLALYGQEEEERRMTEQELSMEKLKMLELLKAGKRRPKLDPRLMDASHVTGEENITVVERESGKKMTGSKAPPLKHLSEWLEQNPGYDVDSKWGDIVRAKGNLSKEMEASRLLKPSNRGRKPKEPLLNQALMGGDYPFAGMAGLAGYPGLMGKFPNLGMNMPFGSLHNMGLANPMFAGLAGLGFPGMMGAYGDLETGEFQKESEKKEKSKESSSKGRKDESEKSKEKGKSSSEKASSSSTPHPSFPMYFNPMLYNPLLAQGLSGNFQSLSGLPTSFASLANPFMANGKTESESDDERKVERRHKEDKMKLKEREVERKMKQIQREKMLQEEAQDLSVKRKASRKPDSHLVKKVLRQEYDNFPKDEQMEACDLSMKPKNSRSSSSSSKSQPSSDSHKPKPHILNTPTVKSSSLKSSTPLSTSTPNEKSFNALSSVSSGSKPAPKSKNKIFSSLKLSKIVDSLKEKVQNIEEKEKKKIESPKDEPPKLIPHTVSDSSACETLDLSKSKLSDSEKEKPEACEDS